MGAKEAVDVFDEWAKKGKDDSMVKNHTNAVEEMLGFIETKINEQNHQFTAADIGCGNGWVVRKLKKHPQCKDAFGVDGAISMIEKAKHLDPDGRYEVAILPYYKPKEPVDIVHSMEFMYYLKDPKAMLKDIHNIWLKQKGWAVIGIDFYFEHKRSHEWPQQVGTHMTMMNEDSWIQAWRDAGFSNITSWRANISTDFPGTLVICGQRTK